MDSIRIILLVIAILFILYNVFLQFGLIYKLASFCIATSSLGQYWSNFFKAGFSFNAIFSSIFGFILALAVFIIITPIVLLRGKGQRQKISDGLLFEYTQEVYDNVKDKEFYTNGTELNLPIPEHKATGNIQLDAVIIMGQIEEAMKERDNEVSFDVMKDILLKNGETAKIPLLLTVNNKSIPCYIIYDQTQKEQFIKISAKLKQDAYPAVLYYSCVPI